MKKTLLILSLFLLTIQLSAERVNKETALKVAKTIVSKTDLNEMATRNHNNLYIFSSDNSFVIVSADDRVRPIIGYSDNNSFALSETKTNVNYWLDKVNDEIQYAIDNNLEATEEIQNEWKTLLAGNTPTPKNRAVVDALLTTQWDQDSPFNNMCPGGSVTGCAATAMAQVMKYWNWPMKGVNSHSYYEDDYGTLSADFENTLYDWNNMKDRYSYSSSAVEKEAVATLMFHCGVALEMDYSPVASGAYPSDIAIALKSYFNYKNTAQDKMDWYYSDAQWIDLLKEELDAERPIIYNGWDIEGGGHSFVCDGYDENDFFHFNWGWGGYCDGYFEIGLLNPGTGGIGSGSGVYSEDNYITIGIEPNFDYENTLHLVTSSDGYEPVINLSWASYYAADSFNVYKIINNNETFLANVTDYTYTDTGLEFNQEYCYVVKSVVDGTENDMSNESCTTIIPNSCFPPSNLSADIVEDDPDYNMKFKITVSWDDADNATKYIVYADDKKYKELTETSLTLGTNKETTIVFTIQSICENDFESNMSEPLTVEVKSSIGIDELENKFEIYPNPVKDKLFIDGETEINDICIFNILGVQVHNEPDVNCDYIDVTNLNKGVYILNIKTNDGTIVRRFIKE